VFLDVKKEWIRLEFFVFGQDLRN